MRCVVAVLGKDRSGIVAGVSRVLAEKGANGLAEELGVQIIIQREDLFQFMYKI